MPATKIGLVGAGAVGRALLERLTMAGFQTTTFDVSAAALAAARELGSATVTSACEAVADAEFVHLCVRSDEELLAATIGPNGVLQSLPSGAVLLLHSTVLPRTSRSVGEIAASRRVEIVDAPVVGVPQQISAGDACFLIGGLPAVAERVRPHLLALGRAVYYFGPLGSGNVAKLAKNLATAVERVSLTEAVALAEAGGVDPAQLLNMMRDIERPLFESWERAFAVEDGHATPLPATNLLEKDIQLAAALATELDLVLPVATSAADRASAWVATWRSNGEVRIHRTTPG